MNRLVLRLSAALLVLAASFKIYHLVLDGVHEPWGALKAWEAVGEFVIGLWLCSGIAVRCSHLCATGLFVILTVVSVWQAIRGDASCGCFGAVSVPPLVMVVVNSVLVLLLAVFRPKDSWLPSNRIDIKKGLVAFTSLLMVMGGFSIYAHMVHGSIRNAAAFLFGETIIAERQSHEVGELTEGGMVEATFELTNVTRESIWLIGVKST